MPVHSLIRLQLAARWRRWRSKLGRLGKSQLRNAYAARMLVDSCIIAESDHLAHVPAQDAHLFTEDHMNGRFLRCIAEPRAAHVKQCCGRCQTNANQSLNGQ